MSNNISFDKMRGFKFCLLYVGSERTHVTEICVLLGPYAAQNGSLLLTFRFNLSVPTSKVKQFLTYSYFCTNVQALAEVAIRLVCVFWIGNGKGKVHPTTSQEGPEGVQRYSPTLSLTSALDGVGGQRHAPAALPPGITRFPLYRRLRGPHDLSVWLRKISPHRDTIPGPSSP